MLYSICIYVVYQSSEFHTAYFLYLLVFAYITSNDLRTYLHMYVVVKLTVSNAMTALVVAAYLQKPFLH